MDTIGHERVVGTLDKVQIGLLIAALLATIPLQGHVAEPAHWPWTVALAGVLIAYRVVLVVRRHQGAATGRLRLVGFWVTAPLVFAVVWMSPVFGLYSFTGYIEWPSLGRRWWQRVATLLVTATITALAQVGGPRSILFHPSVYGLILVLNIAIAVLISTLEGTREKGYAELERTVTELRAAEAREAVLRDQLITQARDAGVTEERQRLSREIHDTVAQSLVGIITQLEAAEVENPAERDRRLARVEGTARDALGEVRRAVRALASPRLDDASLPDALEGLVLDSRRTTGLDVTFVVDGSAYLTRADAELVRIAQEALANVIRHAGASRAAVTLSYSDQEVRLDVRDNGRGFDPRVPTSGRGLIGMRERVTHLGGVLEIETSDGGSCTISAAIPR